MPVRPYRVTVVCLGNICRSPIGEAVLRARVAEAGLADLIDVDSAGTGSWYLGGDADPRSKAVLAEHGYPLDHTARRIDHTWFEAIDLVIAMDSRNYEALEALIARSGEQVELRMMRSFDPDLAHLPQPSDALDVPDPYYGGPEGFDDVLDMIERAVAGLMHEFPQRLGS